MADRGRAGGPKMLQRHCVMCIGLLSVLMLASATVVAGQGSTHTGGHLPAADEPTVSDSAVDMLQRFVAQADMAQGRFSQTVTMPSASRAEVSTGRFAYRRPGKFRWEYVTPYPQLLVGDGERLWIWDPDLAQASVRAIGDALTGTPLAALVDGSPLSAQFELSSTGRIEDGVRWVDARPLSESTAFSSVRFGLEGDTLVYLDLRDSFGQQTMIALRFDPVVASPDDALFRFDLPAGADLIEQ